MSLIRLYSGLVGRFYHFILQLLGGLQPPGWVYAAFFWTLTVFLVVSIMVTLDRILYLNILMTLKRWLRKPFRRTTRLDLDDTGQLSREDIDAAARPPAVRDNKTARPAKTPPIQTAQELEAAGKTLEAAKVYAGAGHHGQAARLYFKHGKYGPAEKEFRALGDHGGVAACLARRGRPVKAAELYRDYFLRTTDPPPRQWQVAEECANLLGSEKSCKQLDDALRQDLTEAVAIRLHEAKRQRGSAN